MSKYPSNHYYSDPKPKNGTLFLRAMIIIFGATMSVFIAYFIKDSAEELDTEQQKQTVMMNVIEKTHTIARTKKYDKHEMRLAYKGRDYVVDVSLKDYKNHEIGDTIACKHIEGSDIALPANSKNAKAHAIFAILLFLFSVFCTIKLQNPENW
jgi:hypothetical protein